MRSRIFLWGVGILSVVGWSPAAAGPWVVRVETGAHARLDTLVSLRWPGRQGKEIENPIVVETTGGQSIPTVAQWAIADGSTVPARNYRAYAAVPTVVWRLTGETAAGAVRTFTLDSAPAGKKETSSPLSLLEDERSVTLRIGGRPLARYQHAVDPAPAGESILFARSGFVYPLWSPAGAELAQQRPADHLHHLGLWHAWTETHWQGLPVDFWNLKKGLGTVRFAGYRWRASGPLWCGLGAHQEHVALKSDQGQTVVLDEELTLRGMTGGTGAAAFLALDYDFAQKNITSHPLELPVYRYGGGLGYRGPASWNRTNSDYLTSEAKTRNDSHQTRGRWIAMHGPTPQGIGSVIILSHPTNHNAPQRLRTWNDDKEGRIFFNYAPTQETAWAIAPGETHSARYRVITCDTAPDVARIESWWHDYAEPPIATVVP
jgi:Methane oxygenase PmoA